MKKPAQWFDKKSQQSIMSRVSTFPLIVRTGPNSKSVQEKTAVKPGEKVFVVGESEVGGDDRVGGTP